MWKVPGEIDMPDDTDTGVYTGEYIFRFKIKVL